MIAAFLVLDSIPPPSQFETGDDTKRLCFGGVSNLLLTKRKCKTADCTFELLIPAVRAHRFPISNTHFVSR